MFGRLALGLFLLLPFWLVPEAYALERHPAIVVLEAPSLAEHLMATRTPEERRLGRPPRQRLFTREAEEYRQGLRRARQGLAARLTARGMVLEGQTETVLNALLVRASEEELEWLRAQPEVKKAEFAERVQLLLDAALPLLGGPQAWAALGGEDSAGRGVKIGVIDTGIDQTHPMLDSSTLVVPQGFPKVGRPEDAAFTNNKVIVARNFSGESDPADRRGHGTFVAAVAAGRRAQSPLASIAGVAPGAFLGSYKVFGATGDTTLSAVIEALDRAVSDGMDIVNLSLSSDARGRLPEGDPHFDAIRNAVNLGVVVVAAAGNCGPGGSPRECSRVGPRTVHSPGILPDVITVGATSNSRSFVLPLRATAPQPVPQALETLPSLAGSQPRFTSAVGPAAVVDVAQLDSNGFGCSALPAGSLSGKIALIQRGGVPTACLFRDKVSNAAQAGAIGVVIYNNMSGTVRMNTDGATIPSVSLTQSDGLSLRAFVRANPEAVRAVMEAQTIAFPQPPDLVLEFSSRGAPPDFSIKPDLVAPGADIHSAAQNRDNRGELFDPDRYITFDGTSFSAPLVAGAAALVKQARPGLTPAEIKSALVNTATPVTSTAEGAAISVMHSGAGKPNLPAALSTTLAAQPVSLSFREHSPRSTFSGRQAVRLTNKGTAAATYTVSVAPRSADPNLKVEVDKTSFTLAAASGTELTVSVSNTGILQSSYEGFISIRDQATNAAIHVPYWVTYAVPEVDPGGVVNGASFGPAVSPGSIVTLFGLALGGSTAVARSLPLPRVLGGTALRISGADVPLFFSSTMQINAQLPFDLQPGTASGFVRLDEVLGPTFSFPVSEFSPGIFTLGQGGTGAGAILHAASGVVVSSRSPARAGDFVSVFCTGLGAVTSPPQQGTAAPSDPLSTTLAQPTVTMGGVSAAVQFSGLAPGFAGLYQVNVQVPGGLRAGEQPLVINIGGAASNTVTIAVQ